MDYITQIQNDYKKSPKKFITFFDKKNNRLIVGLVLLINKMGVGEFLKDRHIGVFKSLTIFEKDKSFEKYNFEEVFFEIKYTIDLNDNSITKNEDDNTIKIKDFDNYDYINNYLFFYFLENNLEKKYLLFINELSVFEYFYIDTMNELSKKYNIKLHKLIKNNSNNETKTVTFLLDNNYLLNVHKTETKYHFWIITSDGLKHDLIKVVNL